MTSPKHITLVTSLYWPELIGSGPYCADIAVALVKAGHVVKVLTCRPHYPSELWFPEWQNGLRDVDVQEGVSIRRTASGTRVSGKLLERFKNDLRFFWFVLFVQKETKTYPPDIVVSLVPSSFAALAGRILSSRHKAKHIVMVHDIESGLAKSLDMAGAKIVFTLIRILERISLEGATQIITLTDAMSHALRDNAVTAKITTIPIWAEIPNPKVELSHPRSFTLMYSGNFGRKQNLDQLLPLFDRLKSVLPSVQVVMNGEGTERARFEKAARAQGLTNIVFGDLVPKDDLIRTLRSADIHIVPQAEGTSDYLVPSKVTTILAAGCPFLAIGSETGALADLARDSGAGIVLSSSDADTFVSTIKYFSTYPEKLNAMGQLGTEYVKENFDKKDVLSRYIQLIAR